MYVAVALKIASLVKYASTANLLLKRLFLSALSFSFIFSRFAEKRILLCALVAMKLNFKSANEVIKTITMHNTMIKYNLYAIDTCYT